MLGLPRVLVLVAVGGIVALLLSFAPSAAHAEAGIGGGHWIERACGTAFPASEGPCFESVGQIDESVIVNDAEWDEMVDTYAELGYRSLGETIPTELVNENLDGPLTLFEGLAEYDNSIPEYVGQDALPEVEDGFVDLLSKGGWVDSFGAAVGTVGAAATAFYVGWEIGSAIDSIFHIGGSQPSFQPAQIKWQPDAYTAVDPGVEFGESPHWCAARATCTPFVTPQFGFIVHWADVEHSHGAREIEITQGPYANEVSVSGAPAGAEKIQIESWTEGESTGQRYIWFIPAPFAGLHLPTTGASHVGHSNVRSPAPSLQSARAAAEGVLTGTTSADQEFNGWAYHHGARPGAAGAGAIRDPTAPVKHPTPDQCHPGGLRSSCVAALQELDVVPKVTELDWSQVHVKHLNLDDPEVTREEEAGRIVTVPNPLPSEVTRGQDFPLTVNPALEDMPQFIPKPRADETYDEYVARLNPALAPVEHILGELYADPRVGPERVSTTSPAPGSKVGPHATTQVRVSVNPSTAPDPSDEGETEQGTEPGGGTETGGGLPTVPAIAIPGGAVHPCGVFPFGLFCWVKEGFEQINVTPKCPSAQVPLGVKNDTVEMGICKLPEVEHWMGLWRILVMFFFTVGCAWTFSKATGAIGAGGDD